MIKAIAFDLDDTLIDTTTLLVPIAARGACEIMRDGGLPWTLDECLAERARLAPQHSGREIFHLIATKAGASNPQALGDLGSRAFYHPALPERIPLMTGAAEALEACRQGRLIFLVTSGAPEAQWQKVRAAGLLDTFHGVFVIDKMKNEKKGAAFTEILRRWSLQPNELLSVGNRLREEIREARKLGALGCHFDYGEHQGETPESPHDRAEFRVTAWADFLRECRL